MSRTKTSPARRVTTISAAAVAGVLLTAGVAVADNINDDIEGDGAVVTLTAGSATSAAGRIKLVSTGGDGDNGCNIDPGEAPLVLDVQTPHGVTADVDPLSITRCDEFYTVRFTAAADAVDGVATVRIVSTPAGGGTYNNNVRIPIDVINPNTAPSVAVSGVVDGTTYRVGDVPAPGCDVEDAEDVGESAAPSVTNGVYDALGSHTVTCSYTDGGRLTRSATATYDVIRALDTTPPVIRHDVSAVDGSDGWHRGDVDLDWTVTEADSPETLESTGCDDVTVATDQAATVYTCSATSEGGTTSRSVTIKRDGTAPTVTYGEVVGGTLGQDGWYTSPVTVRFDATDATSGVSPSSREVTSSGEGDAVTVPSPVFTDAAGNASRTAAALSETLKIDTSAPTAITFTGVPTTPVHFGNVPESAALGCAATDAVSGLASCTVSGRNGAVGTHTLTATAVDRAGNRSTATMTYTVLPWTTKGFYAPVDMTPAGAAPVYNTVKGGSTVPLKFELFAGATELTSTSSVLGFTATKVGCQSGVEDAIETLATTGGTSFRYDTTGGQFVQNWKTPTSAGTCYKATVAAADGSTVSAYFKIK